MNTRQIIEETVAGREDITPDQIDEWTTEVEAFFGLESGETATAIDRWKCYRCVAKNMAAAVAIAVAVASFGPASPGVISYIATKFGISEMIAEAAVGGLKGAALAKMLCGSVC